MSKDSACLAKCRRGASNISFWLTPSPFFGRLKYFVLSDLLERRAFCTVRLHFVSAKFNSLIVPNIFYAKTYYTSANTGSLSKEKAAFLDTLSVRDNSLNGSEWRYCRSRLTVRHVVLTYCGGNKRVRRCCGLRWSNFRTKFPPQITYLLTYSLHAAESFLRS